MTRSQVFFRVLTLVLCAGLIVGCGEKTSESSTKQFRVEAGDPYWYFDHARELFDDASINGVWPESLAEVSPRRSPQTTSAVVDGGVLKVEEGRGYVYVDNADASDRRDSVPFESEQSDARDLVVSIRVQEVLSSAGDQKIGQNDVVRVRFGSPPAWNAQEYASSLLGLSEAVFFLTPRAAPDADEFGVVGPGPLIGLIGPDGSVTFPGVAQPGLGVPNFMKEIKSLKELRIALED